MTPVDFMLIVAILVGSACDQFKSLTEIVKRVEDEKEMLVKCGVCGWQVNASFGDDVEFPVECHNCGVNAVEPVESEEAE